MEKFYRIEIFTILTSENEAVAIVDNIRELLDNEGKEYHIRVFAEEDIIREEE